MDRQQLCRGNRNTFDLIIEQSVVAGQTPYFSLRQSVIEVLRESYRIEFACSKRSQELPLVRELLMERWAGHVSKPDQRLRPEVLKARLDRIAGQHANLPSISDIVPVELRTQQ